ncbi:MAG: hypothetical protein AMJ81_06085 [Phycisphaerae bacterium SM23_33]|nr:MAG: hypothetical protein AMJ81_06085 [Phycisphaerae bacterium SM23_33]
MDWVVENWPWIVVGVVVVFSFALYIFRKWREAQAPGDAAKERIYDLVEMVLDTLRKMFQDEMRQVDEARVDSAAREVYRQFIKPTMVSLFISEDEFAQRVLEGWRDLAGVEGVVAAAVAR